MLTEDRWIQFGKPREEIKGIIIHNTSNYQMSARQLFDYLQNESKDSRGCHYLVDYKEVIEVMPLNYSVWNSGVAYDFANTKGIAIEICSNLDKQKYLKGQAKAIKLIKSLMKEYNLTKDDIYFHNDFLNVNCPANILQIYKTKKNFINKFFGGKINGRQKD